MAKLYKNFVTKELKFFNREAMLEYMEGKGLNVSVEGCYITNTSSYVDISLNPLLTPDKIFEYSSVLFNQDYTSYIAYIDRIEPNNFNGQDGASIIYYRLYITIDWWSTILYQEDGNDRIAELCSKVEGLVERAHVDDCKKESGKIKLNLDYTLLDAEYPVDRYKRKSYKLNDDTKYMYIFTTKEVESHAPFVSTPDVIIGDKTIKSAMNCVLASPSTTYMRIKYKLQELGSSTIEEKIEDVLGLSAPDVLADSSVVGIYLTDYMPFNIEDNVIDMGLYRYISGTSVSDLTEPFDFDLVGGRTQPNCGGVILGNITSKNIYGQQFFKTKANYVYNIPTTYKEYCEGIAKQYFAPYTYSSFEKAGGRVVLDTAHITDEGSVEYVCCPYIAGYIFYIPTELSVGENAYHVITDDSLYERTSTNDQFTRISAMSASLKFLGKAVSSVGAIGAGVASGNGLLTAGGIASMSSLAGEGIQSYSQNKKMLRDGESGSKLVSNSASDYISPLCITVIEPDKEEVEALREDLALYGYNTYLHPFEVLGGHKRKYFNYIRTRASKLNISQYSNDIKAQIEELFNNGVWLWNEATTFGNFKVPNYPIILES